MATRKKKKQMPLGKEEGNKYDKIVKENFESLIPAFLNKVLYTKVDRMENLPQIKVQTTREVEPDFIRIAYNADYPEGFIFQLEIEAKDEKKTDSKTLLYTAMDHFKYQMPVIVEMIYLLEGRPKNITGKVTFGNLTFHYPVHCLNEISFREFIYSNVPEEVLLTVLADPEDTAPAEIVRMVLERLKTLKGNSNELWKFINQLKILSMLRNLHEETEKQIENMVINEDIVRQIKQDKMFLLGTEEGREEGREIGREEGREEGEIKKAIVSILIMHEKGLPKETIAEFSDEPLSFVKKILTQCKKKERVISLLKKKKGFKDIAKQLKVSAILVEVIKERLNKKE